MKRSRALLLAVLVLLPWQSNAAQPPDATVSNFNVEIDMHPVVKTLGVGVGQFLFDHLGERDECQAAAILVAQQAAENYGYWDTFIGLLKQTARGIEDGAKLAGEERVSNIAALASSIIDAVDTDDPPGALGRLMIQRASDLVSDQWSAGPATRAKEAVVETLRERLKDTLFPGRPQKAKDYRTTFGSCTVTVTPEFEFGSPGHRGGVRVLIDGDCQCKKPLQLTTIAPLQNAHLQSFKNAGLGRFKVIIFYPIRELQSSSTLSGKVVNLKKVWQTAVSLKEAIQNGNLQEARKTEKELEDLVGTATNVTANVTLTPVLGNPELETVDAECNNCDQRPPLPPTIVPPPPPQPTADYLNIERRCDPDERLRTDITHFRRTLKELDPRLVDFNYIRGELKKSQDEFCSCLLGIINGRGYGKPARDTAQEVYNSYCSDWTRTPTPAPPTPPSHGTCDYSFGGSKFVSPPNVSYSQFIIHCPASAPVVSVSLIGHKFVGSLNANGVANLDAPCPCRWTFSGTTATLHLNPAAQKGGWGINAFPIYDRSDPSWNNSCDGMSMTLVVTQQNGRSVTLPFTMPAHNTYGNCSLQNRPFMLDPPPAGR